MMSNEVRLFLDEAVGSPCAKRLADAYEDALMTVSLGQPTLMPNRATRSAMVDAMIAEAKRNPTDAEALTNAAIRAADVW